MGDPQTRKPQPHSLLQIVVPIIARNYIPNKNIVSEIRINV